ncbi:MAG: hypothetical protein BZ138_05840, partial [Methanosphaera sp. rholeuAM270]
TPGVSVTAKLSADNLIGAGSAPAEPSATLLVGVNIPVVEVSSLVVNPTTPSAESTVHVTGTFKQSADAELFNPTMTFDATEQANVYRSSKFANVTVKKNGAVVPSNKWASEVIGNKLTVMLDDDMEQNDIVTIEYDDVIAAGTASNDQTLNIKTEFSGQNRTSGATKTASYTVQTPALSLKEEIVSPMVDGVPVQTINVGDAVTYELTVSQTNPLSVGRGFKAELAIDDQAAAHGVYYDVDSFDIIANGTSVKSNYTLSFSNSNTKVRIEGKEGHTDLTGTPLVIRYKAQAGTSTNTALRDTTFQSAPKVSVTNLDGAHVLVPKTIKIASATSTITLTTANGMVSYPTPETYQLVITNTSDEALSKIKGLKVTNYINQASVPLGYAYDISSFKLQLKDGDGEPG